MNIRIFLFFSLTNDSFQKSRKSIITSIPVVVGKRCQVDVLRSINSEHDATRSKYLYITL